MYSIAKEFGSIIEDDHIFPAVESRGLGGEQSALLVRDRYSGMCLTYPQRTRIEDSNYDALKHFGGNKLNGNPDVVFHSDTAQELTNAASRLGWVADPSAANHWHTMPLLKEKSGPSRRCAGHRTCRQASTEGFGPFPSSTQPLQDPSSLRLRFTEDERDTEEGKKKLGKTRWKWPQVNL